jgi:hypothetical protein
MVGPLPFLIHVAGGRCAAALGLQPGFTDGDVRRGVAAFHPDRGGQTELCALANACAHSLRTRRPLGGLYRRTAVRLQGEYWKQLQEDQGRRHEQPPRTAEPPRHEHEETVRRVLDACQESSLRRGALFTELHGALRVALNMRRCEVVHLLQHLGVTCVVCGGSRKAARDSRGLQLTPEARAILRELAAARVG